MWLFRALFVGRSKDVIFEVIGLACFHYLDGGRLVLVDKTGDNVLFERVEHLVPHGARGWTDIDKIERAICVGIEEIPRIALLREEILFRFNTVILRLDVQALGFAVNPNAHCAARGRLILNKFDYGFFVIKGPPDILGSDLGEVGSAPLVPSAGSDAPLGFGFFLLGRRVGGIDMSQVFLPASGRYLRDVVPVERVFKSLAPAELSLHRVGARRIEHLLAHVCRVGHIRDEGIIVIQLVHNIARLVRLDVALECVKVPPVVVGAFLDVLLNVALLLI